MPLWPGHDEYASPDQFIRQDQSPPEQSAQVCLWCMHPSARSVCSMRLHLSFRRTCEVSAPVWFACDCSHAPASALTPRKRLCSEVTAPLMQRIHGRDGFVGSWGMRLPARVTRLRVRRNVFQTLLTLLPSQSSSTISARPARMTMFQASDARSLNTRLFRLHLCDADSSLLIPHLPSSGHQFSTGHQCLLAVAARDNHILKGLSWPGT